LLVVDNCEHLLQPAAQLVSDILGAAPGVRVIATSREPLSVSGEHIVPVTPLELPQTSAAEARKCASTRVGVLHSWISGRAAE
jgi:predicted ATPase